MYILLLEYQLMTGKWEEGTARFEIIFINRASRVF